MSTVHETIVDLIYEAGVMPQRWPAALDQLASLVSAKGAILMRHSAAERRWTLSPTIEPLMQEFVEQGWMHRNPRIDNYQLAMPHAGFQIDDDFMVRSEFEDWPIYREFFLPHGLGVGAGTVIQGAKNDGFLVTIEGFRNPHEARRKIVTLDLLRPHIARAATLSALFEENRLEAAVGALSLLGVAAAMLDGNGRIQSASGGFHTYIGDLVQDRADRMHLADVVADRALPSAIAAIASGNGQSLAVRRSDQAPVALHLVPIRGYARDIFTSTAAIVVIADPKNQSIPNADLLQLLFDLTAREASLARLLLERQTLASAAKRMGIGVETARSHLKATMLKTGTARQSELIMLLASVGLAGHKTR